MEGEAAAALEDIEKKQLRKVARESFSCAVKCYDKAGTTGPAEVLEMCARNCQIPYQQSTTMVQNVRNIAVEKKYLKKYGPDVPSFCYLASYRFSHLIFFITT